MPYWVFIRDSEIIAEFWTPGSAQQYMIDMMKADEAAGLWFDRKPSYEVQQREQED